MNRLTSGLRRRRTALGAAAFHKHTPVVLLARASGAAEQQLNGLDAYASARMWTVAKRIAIPAASDDSDARIRILQEVVESLDTHEAEGVLTLPGHVPERLVREACVANGAFLLAVDHLVSADQPVLEEDSK